MANGQQFGKLHLQGYVVRLGDREKALSSSAFNFAMMPSFATAIKKFDSQGEKTGWTYIEVPADVAEQIKPGCRKSYRVKGKIDNFRIEKVSLLPMGGGGFIIPINATIRKGIGKSKGAMVQVQLTEDKRDIELCPELLECLSDEPVALERFYKQPPSHQRYFSKWINDAKTEETKAKRIALTVRAMVKGLNYGEMIREAKNKQA